MIHTSVVVDFDSRGDEMQKCCDHKRMNAESPLATVALDYHHFHRRSSHHKVLVDLPLGD